MITQSAKIADGVNINYIKTDKFKSNFISFSFITKVDKERVALNALLSRVLCRGSQNYPSQAKIDKKLQYLYSSRIGTRNDTLGEFQIFGLVADVLNDKYTLGTPVTDEILDLICDIVFNPYLENGAFSEQYTESEKSNLIDAINAEINNKTKYANSRCIGEMCKNEIFSIKKTGTAEDVEKITPKSLFEAYKRILKECRIEIYAVGDMDINKITNKFKTHFNDITREVEKIEKESIVRRADSANEVLETQNVKQGKLAMGFRIGKTIEDGNHHITRLFSEVFGGSPTSKLFTNVREKMSLCYYCYSLTNQRNGVLLVSAGIECENKEIAQNAILEQLESIKNGKITPEELESAKKSLKNSFMHVYDSPEGMQSWSLYRMLSGDYSTPMQEATKTDATTVDEIANLAKGITLDTVYFLKGETVNG